MSFGTNTFGSPYFGQGPVDTCLKYYAGDWSMDWCVGSSSSSSSSTSSSSSSSSSSLSSSSISSSSSSSSSSLSSSSVSISSSSSSSRSFSYSSSSSESTEYDDGGSGSWPEDWPIGFRRPEFKFDQEKSSSSSSSSQSISSSSSNSSSSNSSSSSSGIIIKLSIPDIRRFPIVFLRPLKESTKKIDVKVSLKEENENKPTVIIKEIKEISDRNININVSTIKSK